MYKTVTEETIRQACSERISAIRAEEEEQLKSVEQQTRLLAAKFEEVIDKAGFSSNAFVPSGKLDLLKDSRSLPDGLFVGMLKHPFTGEDLLPAILPYVSANATGFCVDSYCENQVSELMQTLAFRILLSIPVELVKCHFIDLHSFGQSTKLFNRLAEESEKITKGALVSDKNKLAELVTELENHINHLNRNELLDVSDLREYNADPSHIAVPYHFVFFSRIHDKVDKDILSRIYSLCSGRNASTCGIYFFYTIDREAVQPQNDILNDLLSISMLVSRDDKGFHLSNSVYGKDFDERYSFIPEKRIPANLNQIIDAIAKKAANIKPPVVSFDQMLEDMMASGNYWKGSTIEGITIPIGRKGADKIVNFNIAGNTADYFAMIGGRPGYGKTVLLHDIICNGAIIYPPQELEFYLIDCTNGTGFKPYEHLPHARFVSITKQREYTDSAIDYLIEEMYRRADLFKEAGDQTKKNNENKSEQRNVEKIEDYRKFTQIVLPRILVIIDEFQVLLEKKDRLSTKIRGSLEKIIREGRKYGISIVFCTQSYRNIDIDTELITLRIAFNLKEMDSLKVLGSGNDSAAHLTKKGEAILNNSNGEKEANVLFQAAYTEKVQQYVGFCVDRWNEIEGPKPKRFVFDGKAVSNLANNIPFVDSLSESPINPDRIVTWIGVPLFIKEEHSYATFRKAIGSNMLICGTDKKAALSTIALVNYQISQSLEDFKQSMYIADYFGEESNESLYLRRFAEIVGIPYLLKRELEPKIDSIESILKERINNDMIGINNMNTPIVVTIAYVQNAPPDMKKDRTNQVSKTMSKIQYILKNGPDYGIHLIVYAYHFKGLGDVMNEHSSFGNRVILQGGAINPQMVQEVDALSEGTALLFTEDASTKYEKDPIMIYNKCESSSLQRDEVLDHIFSIYNQKQE